MKKKMIAIVLAGVLTLGGSFSAFAADSAAEAAVESTAEAVLEEAVSEEAISEEASPEEAAADAASPEEAAAGKSIVAQLKALGLAPASPAVPGNW